MLSLPPILCFHSLWIGKEESNNYAALEAALQYKIINWPHSKYGRKGGVVLDSVYCSLTSLLENNPVVPIGTKVSIIKDVALGLRYLHTRNPPIIHRDLSSNNVLLSKGMEGKLVT